MKPSRIKQVNIHILNYEREESSCALISKFHAKYIEKALERMPGKQKAEVIENIINNLKESKQQ